jgi:hypothetical protein
MKQITFKQYRTIDITILCVMTAIFEYIVCLATNQWATLQAMAVSITLMMTCITAFRWSYFAVFPALIGSLSYSLAYGADLKQIIYFCGGSLFCILTVPLLKKLGKESVRINFVKRSFYAITVYIAIAIGRWLISLIFNFSLQSLILMLTTDILSLLFAIVVLTIVKNLDGILEDQKAYLLRLDKERREIEEANQSDPFNDPY